MAKIKYYYDTETCRYERIKTTKTDVALNLLGFLVVSLVLAFGLSLFYSAYFPSHKEIELQASNEKLLYQYQLLNKEIEEAGQMLTALQERDDKLYRVIFEADPIPMEMRRGGTGGSKAYKDIFAKDEKYQELIVSTQQRVDNLRKQMYIQTKSYDEIVNLVQNKAEMMASIPAIQPIAKKDMTHFASGFGMRMHPIYKVPKMHTGCDLTAPRGTSIYATGNGTVIRAGWEGGYGKVVDVDHGYGYITRYAHMSAIKCKKGQKVKRGQLLGLVGSTGLSQAPHLHYEVHYKGRPVNPINYFFNDLSPEEYDQMLQLAAQNRQPLGSGNASMD
ncbi:MAG: peptidoglycan DD-metalloendopeptidase family protein [Bernardetiaceae bacterium]